MKLHNIQVSQMSSPLFLSPLSPSNNSTSSIPISSFAKSLSSKSLNHKQFKLQANPTPPINKTQPKMDKEFKMPTPPWMKGPLLLPSNQILDLSTNKKKSRRVNDDDWSLTDGVSGGRGQKAMRGIIKSVTKLQKFHKFEEPRKELEEFEFRVPLKQVQVSTNGVSRKKEGNVGNGPWAAAESIVVRRLKKEKVVTAAELSLPETVWKRLRSEAWKIKKWIKVKKPGVTQTVVDEIKRVWSKNELAMVKFDLPLCRNMDRAHEILEIKTGGLVVWTWNDVHVVYRGLNYDPKDLSMNASCADAEEASSSEIKDETTDYFTESHIKSDLITMDGTDGGVGFLTCVDKRLDLQLVSGSLYVREADRLLDGLGPRFIDWWYPKPLPVDADLLPEVVPGFRTPFRRCPPHVRPTVADDELTYLRKLARPLLTHFVLGRNKKLQGLASAVIKLWEKSLIVKIAVKLGSPNTNNEQMATELKRLTGGVLILRNKFFIILYRGKDFLPSGVANVIVDRETELQTWQSWEESARWKASESFSTTDEPVASTSSVGTFSEFQHIQTKYGFMNNGISNTSIRLEAEKQNLVNELRRKNNELLTLKRKIERSAIVLDRLNSSWGLSEQAPDRELITEEERHCLRKMALKMEQTLVLGRRGVFDGVIGSLHQHWKHREVVKVITMQKAFSQVIDTATLLEIESGGTLITVEKLVRGHVIVLYRGKNYQRPIKLLPENLLTKRTALQRSLEMQRIGSLKFFAYQRQKTISNLELKLKDLLKRDVELSPGESEKRLEVTA